MENKICQEFQGTIKNAITINRIRITEDKPTLKRMIDDERGDASIVSMGENKCCNKCIFMYVADY